MVVFPVPFIPTNISTKGSVLLRFSEIFSSRLMWLSVFRISSSTCLRLSSTSSLRLSRRFIGVPVRRFSSSSQILSATGNATSFSARFILKSNKIGARLSALSSAVVTFVTRPLKPDLSFSNMQLSVPLSYVGK